MELLLAKGMQSMEGGGEVQAARARAVNWVTAGQLACSAWPPLTGHHSNPDFLVITKVYGLERPHCTLQVRHNKLLCKRKKCMNKHGRHDQADYAIKPKRRRSQWELGSTIVLTFGADATDSFCYIEARKLAF